MFSKPISTVRGKTLPAWWTWVALGVLAAACTADLADLAGAECEDFADAYDACDPSSSESTSNAESMCTAFLKHLPDNGKRCIACVITASCDKVRSTCASSCPSIVIQTFPVSK